MEQVYLCLFHIDHVHDDPPLEHLRQPRLDGKRSRLSVRIGTNR